MTERKNFCDINLFGKYGKSSAEEIVGRVEGKEYLRTREANAIRRSDRARRSTPDGGQDMIETLDNIKRLLTFLRSVDARHWRPDDKVIEPDERDLLGPGHALFATRLGPLDVLGVIEQGRGYDELMADAEEIDFRGHRIRILKLETLVALKRLSKDPRDRHRLPILEDVLRQLRGAAERDDNRGCRYKLIILCTLSRATSNSDDAG